MSGSLLPQNDERKIVLVPGHPDQKLEHVAQMERGPEVGRVDSVRQLVLQHLILSYLLPKIPSFKNLEGYFIFI